MLKSTIMMRTIRSHAGIVKKYMPMARLYVGSTGTLLFGAAAQAAGFVVLAHYLGTAQFGHLMVITSVANVAGTWCGFCPGETLRRQVSRDPSLYPPALGHGLILIFSSGIALSVISITGLMVFMPAVPDPMENLEILLLLVPSNLVLSSYVTFVDQIFLAHHAFARANILNSGFSLARAASPIIACVFFGVSSLRDWAVWYAGVYFGVCAICVAATWRYGTPRWCVLKDDLVLGINLSISGFLIMLRGNIDVLILRAFATPQLVGVYGVARRIIATAFIVPGSFDRLVYGKLAIAGKNGPAASFDLAKRYLTFSVSISAATSVGLFIIAPYVPWLFGADFEAASGIVKILCWTVITTAFQFLAFDALNAADQHRSSAIVSGSTNVAGTAIIVLLASLYGATGIFVGLYVSDVIRGAALWLALDILSRRQARMLAKAEIAQ